MYWEKVTGFFSSWEYFLRSCFYWFCFREQSFAFWGGLSIFSHALGLLGGIIFGLGLLFSVFLFIFAKIPLVVVFLFLVLVRYF